MAERLLPMIETALGEAGIGYAELDRIGATIGPGTFTGLRIGVAAARGLALATGLPCIGVTSLEALAQTACDQVSEGEAIVAAHDARRGQIYLQPFARSGTTVVARAEARAVDPETAMQSVAGLTGIAVGSAAGMVTAGDEARVTAKPDMVHIAPMAVATLAAAKPPTGQPIKPLYLRQPDAKLPSARVMS